MLTISNALRAANSRAVGADPERLPAVSRLGGAMLISIAPVFLGAFLSWFKKARPLSVLLLIVGYAAALVSGFVQPIGIAGVMVVALLAWLCSQTLDGVRGVALHILFLVWAGLLFLHVLPGFQNPLILGPDSFTPDAIPFKMYFNFDKAAIGFALILLYAPICLVKDFERSLLAAATGSHFGDCSYVAAGSLAGRHPLGAEGA